ncbi:hypothetical protein L1N85_10845 [Paenibacillus alkaliterrae]|uniref:hypothetical protein n=1 Tax=Paenibacillus alkaliterrae TaxID=320909 RepID=UPI001F323A99|nr:hypothetical protein [Paenibacillus alkaliterrae]MCF2938933.1 hypothetical protein [Paenibacillus alkaliterrae]
MNRIDHQKILHELAQPYLQMAASSLSNHLERVRVDPVTQTMVESLILALKDKNALATELSEENDKLKEMLKELVK